MSAPVALVTGATRGIGRATAVGLAHDGFDCLAVYASRGDLAESLVREVEAIGRRCSAVQCDVGDGSATAAALGPALDQTGPPQVLVNNAGITRDGLFALMTSADWDDVLRTSLGGFFNLTQLVVRGMIGRRAGRIISVASVSGQSGVAGQVNYSAAKAGLIGATRSLAVELGRFGVTVNAVAPGPVATDMLTAEAARRFEQRIPLGRIGTPEEVAEVIRFLAGPGAGYITGQVIGVNGGML